MNKPDSRSSTAATKPTYSNNDVSQSNDILRHKLSIHLVSYVFFCEIFNRKYNTHLAKALLLLHFLSSRLV